MKKKKKTIRLAILAIFLAGFSFLFLIPIIFTICNSFMASSEITANYGVIFETGEHGARKFILETVNLKFIPDMVSFGQYITVLLKSPEYLLKGLMLDFGYIYNFGDMNKKLISNIEANLPIVSAIESIHGKITSGCEELMELFNEK
ncbi:MAG: hypothetical protein MJ134_10600 [Lachnospiraceae bacterium]|nr:hypothetical protein [Lachnospiraceae bacterium]